MALDQIQKDKIIAALRKLDHNNPEHWSDDGSPRVSVIQNFANDPAIRRTDVNETAPGFIRMTDEGVGGAPAVEGNGGAPAEAQGGGEPTEGEIAASIDVTRETLQDRVNGLVAQHEQNLRDVQDLQRKDQETLKALQAAREDMGMKFPRITAAQNIQDFLRSENQKRVDAAALVRARNNGEMPADFGHGTGKRIGNNKPYATGADGKLVRPMSRLEIARMPRRA